MFYQVIARLQVRYVINLPRPETPPPKNRRSFLQSSCWMGTGASFAVRSDLEEPATELRKETWLFGTCIWIATATARVTQMQSR